MGILNVTPDSFYADSRSQTLDAARQHARQLIAEGADMIDLGACSTRPGAEMVSAEEEWARLEMGLRAIHEVAPDTIISIDTFRADVAEKAVAAGAHIINDISGGEMDDAMFETVARLGVPYILMHMQGKPQTMQQDPHYDDLLTEILQYFARKVQQLHALGVKDIILDPGFGFGKTLEHNYELMRRLSDLQELGLPLLVGISRKSMLYRLLGTTPQEALNATTALNTIALMNGANILRVHDVKECREALQVVQALQGKNLNS